MFVLIWATVLFAVRSSNASKVASPQEIPAEAGLCVVVPCYVPESGFPVESAAWFKCEPECTDSGNILLLNNTSPNAQSGFRGRVSLLEPELSHRNCSIIINDLSQSDSGLYQLLILNGTMKEFTSQNVTITVKDLNQKPTVMIPPLTEGQQTTLTCTAPGLCSGSDPEITWTWRGRGEKDSHITGNITAFKTENLTTVSKRHSSTLTFNSSAEHHGTDVTCKVSFRNSITTEETVTLNVTYVKEPEISGNTAVKEGDTLNLTCSVDSFPPIVITWTKTDLNKKLSNETEIDPKSNTGTTTLVISNVTAQHSGQYNCKAKHLDNILMKEVNITVISYPEILNSSGCINQLEVLTCVCISQGFPLPTIKWPLLKKLTEYSVITKVSHHTVNSTVILAAKDQSNTAVECVSSSGNGEVKRDLRVEQKEAEGQDKDFLGIIIQLEVIIAFLIGTLLSAIVCCLTRKCHRKKQKTYGDVAETLEMMTSQEIPLADAYQAVEDDQAIYHVASEAGGAVAAEKSDVEYSNLDFSLIKKQSPAEKGETQGTPETEYAEIKKEKAQERRDGEGEEEEKMIGEDEETKQGVQDEDAGEDVALYSTVKDVMDQI